MVTEKAFVAVAEVESVTWTVKLEVPAPEGVPLRTPPAERLRPAGTVPEDTSQLKGDVPPVAENVWLYDVPTVPAGREAVDIVSAAATSTMVTVTEFVRVTLPEV
jgi:hypothetical protein